MGLLQDTFGRIGIRGDGVGAYSRVHYGTRYENAFWDDTCFCMTYGDGYGTFRQLVELDVAGHEMSHGVTSHTAGLDYSGDAGGLNEATSDVMGTMVEFYANNAKDARDYLIGEKIDKGTRATCGGWTTRTRRGSQRTAGLRHRQPRPALLLGGGQPPVLPARRGSGTKTIGGVLQQHHVQQHQVAGIGRDRRRAVWYRALTTYWLSSETYPGAANGMVRAAHDLYGATRPVPRDRDGMGAVKVTPSATAPSRPPAKAGNAVINPGFEAGTRRMDGVHGM